MSVAGAGAAVIGAKGLAAGAAVIGALLATWLVVEPREPVRSATSPLAMKTVADLELSASKEAGGARGTTLAAPGSSEPQRQPLVASTVTRIRVLESDGQPNAEQTVVLAPVTGDPHAPARMTDAEGRVEFPASGERRTIAIQRTSAFPHRTEIELVPGELTIVLPPSQGLLLTGRIVADGAPPPSSTWVLLHAASSADQTVDVDDASCLLTSDVTYAPTDAEGRFRFLGLAPGQALNLRMPEGYRRPGPVRTHGHDQEVFHLDGPVLDLLIELERDTLVRGRVVEADGTPVAGATVQIDMESGRSGRDTDAEGRFELFAWEPPASAVVRYARSAPERYWQLGDLPGAKAEFTFTEPGKDIDLGDLVLPPKAGFLLEVRDPGGRPIAGAETNVSRQASGEDGGVWVENAASGAELLVMRRGYRTAFATLPAPAPTSFLVVLEPTNDLTVEVRDAGGSPQSGIEIELTGPEWFFTNQRPGSASLFDEVPRHGSHEGRRGSVWGGNPTRVRFRASREGRCSMGDLSAQVLHLSVLDDLDAVLHEQDLTPLGPTEARAVQVRLDVVPAVLRGRVVNEHGDPLPGADVAARRARSPESSSRRTDDLGRFQFPHVTHQSLRLAATKRGFLPVVREYSSLPAGDVELVLVRGADVLVRILDSEGRSFVPVDSQAAHVVGRIGRMVLTGGGSSHGPKVRARPVGATEWIDADPLEDGAFELAGLASVVHELELELTFGVLRETWAPPQREVVFHLDTIGTAVLAWNLAPDPSAAGYHVRIEPAGGGAARERHLDTTPRGRMGFQLFAGDYEVVLVAERPTPDGGWRSEDVRRWPLAVGSGETVHLELGP
jgi:hypothetical protein